MRESRDTGPYDKRLEDRGWRLGVFYSNLQPPTSNLQPLMNDSLNPQAREMADESMVRNLAAQADAIWPQEQRLFDRYRLPARAQVLDGGCGTGEISARLSTLFPEAMILGVDVVDDHLARARVKCSPAGSRVRFENRSIFE